MAVHTNLEVGTSAHPVMNTPFGAATAGHASTVPSFSGAVPPVLSLSDGVSLPLQTPADGSLPKLLLHNGQLVEIDQCHEAALHHHVSTANFWLALVLAFFLTCCAGCYSGLTVGLLGMDETQLQVLLVKRQMSFHHESAVKVRNYIANHHRLLCTLLVGNTIALETLPIMLDKVFPAWLAIFISVFCVLVFAETLPMAYLTGPKRLDFIIFLDKFIRVSFFLFAPVAGPGGRLLDRIVGGGHGGGHAAQGEDKCGNAGEQTAVAGEHGSRGTCSVSVHKEGIFLVSAPLDGKGGSFRAEQFSKHPLSARCLSPVTSTSVVPPTTIGATSTGATADAGEDPDAADGIAAAQEACRGGSFSKQAGSAPSTPSTQHTQQLHQSPVVACEDDLEAGVGAADVEINAVGAPIWRERNGSSILANRFTQSSLADRFRCTLRSGIPVRSARGKIGDSSSVRYHRALPEAADSPTLPAALPAALCGASGGLAELNPLRTCAAGNSPPETPHWQLSRGDIATILDMNFPTASARGMDGMDDQAPTTLGDSCRRTPTDIDDALNSDEAVRSSVHDPDFVLRYTKATLRFETKRVGDLDRRPVFSLRGDEPVTDELLARVRRSGFARIPVLGKPPPTSPSIISTSTAEIQRDSEAPPVVRGFLRARDLLGVAASRKTRVRDVGLEAPVLVDPDTRLRDLLAVLRRPRAPKLAVVVSRAYATRQLCTGHETGAHGVLRATEAMGALRSGQKTTPAHAHARSGVEIEMADLRTSSARVTSPGPSPGRRDGSARGASAEGEDEIVLGVVSLSDLVAELLEDDWLARPSRCEGGHITEMTSVGMSGRSHHGTTALRSRFASGGRSRTGSQDFPSERQSSSAEDPPCTPQGRCTDVVSLRRLVSPTVSPALLSRRRPIYDYASEGVPQYQSGSALLGGSSEQLNEASPDSSLNRIREASAASISVPVAGDSQSAGVHFSGISASAEQESTLAVAA